jgi:hypothetical protein
VNLKTSLCPHWIKYPERKALTVAYPLALKQLILHITFNPTMRPHSALLALAAATSLTVAVVLPPVPDEFGLFIGHNYDNGTLVLESLSNPTLAPIVTQHESKRADPTVLTRSAKFGLVAKSVPLDKRRTDCWGSRLDSSGVDDSMAQYEIHIYEKSLTIV